jgi:DNA-binding NtrC family response regulator
VSDAPTTGRARVAVVADDLIWATRLRDGLARAGAEPIGIRAASALATELPSLAGCLVDLTARAYDGIEAVRAAAAAGVPVIAVGQHDDAETRRAATQAGATRVYAYRALFEHGDRVLGAWIATLSPDAQPTEAPMPGPATTPEHVA